MLKHIVGAVGDLVLSSDHCGYDEILNSFKDAASVTVVTFNVSLRADSLIQKLRDLNVPVRLITNIPSRWKKNDCGVPKRTDAVAEYMDALNPEQFGAAASVYFCFSNHAKVVMTDKVGYVGSANYSNESAANWEFGIIIRDPSKLAEVAAALDDIERHSVRYYGPSVQQSIGPLLGIAAHFKELSDRLGDDFERVDENELRNLVEQLRQTVADSDPALSEGYDGDGPIYGKIDESFLGKIEDWFGDEMCVWEFRQSVERLKAAERGEVELPFDNDGNPIDSAQQVIIEDRLVKREGYAIKVQKKIPSLQKLIADAVEQIVEVCNEVSEGIARIEQIPRAPAAVDQKCPKCGKALMRKSGKHGAFLGCSDFPKCKGSRSLNRFGVARNPPL